MDQARLRANFMRSSTSADARPRRDLWYGGHQVIAGNLNVGDIVSTTSMC